MTSSNPLCAPWSEGGNETRHGIFDANGEFVCDLADDVKPEYVAAILALPDALGALKRVQADYCTVINSIGGAIISADTVRAVEGAIAKAARRR